MSSNNALAHYGVKGMRWGVRRDRSSGGSSGGSSTSTPSSEDHTRVAGIKSQAKAHGKHVLSNKELQDAINRMNLEQQYDRLVKGKSDSTSRLKTGEKYLKNTLSVGRTINEVVAFTNSPTGKFLKSQLQGKN